MRLLLFCLFLLLPLCLFGQGLEGYKVSTAEKNPDLSTLFQQISRQTGLEFSYSSSLFDAGQRLSLPPGTYAVEALLQTIFTPLGIEFIRQGQQLVLTPRVFSKKPLLLRGRLIDSTSLLPLYGATLYVPQLQKGVVTDSLGRFQLQLPPGVWQLEASLLGYHPQRQQYLLTADTSLLFSMRPTLMELGEVVVQDQQQNNRVLSLSMGKEELDMENLQAMPAMFGEADILKSLQLLPGIQSAAEGMSGLLVRGGSADQTLVMLNEATVYSPAHFMGFFSVFNPEAIQGVEIYKGGIPARWGGRLASIVNNEVKTGNDQQWKVQGGVGLISSRLAVQGPLLKEKASLLLAARRSYFDLLLKAAPDRPLQASNLYFYDFNGSLHLRLNPNNQLRLSSYSGEDVAGFNQLIKVNWGNRVHTAEWLHAFSPQLLLSTALHHSSYGYGFNIDSKDELQFEWSSRLKETSARLDFDYQLNQQNLLQFGYNASRRTYFPVYLYIKESNTEFGDIELDKKHVLEHALFVQNQHQLTDKLSLLYGLRYSLFHNLGPGRVFLYDKGQPKTIASMRDTLNFGSGTISNSYHGPEPRIIGRYLLSETTSLKFSYNRMRQYSQVASSATASLPTDRWVPSDTYIKPQIADQWTLGYFREWKKKGLDFSAEFYYKRMQNQIDFKDGVTLMGNITTQNADVSFNNALETQILSGRAWSYGLELMVRKEAGPFTGWLAYTLSRTRRQIEGINQGSPYFPRYDRPHDLSLVANYKFSKRLELSGNWVFTSGHAITLPEGKYSFEGRQVPYYNPDERNSSRMPNYHRLDLSLSLHQKKKETRRWQGSWSLSLYNTYFRKNPMFIQFMEVINNDPLLVEQEVEEVYSRELRGVKVYFTLIPALSYNFSF